MRAIYPFMVNANLDVLLPAVYSRFAGSGR